MSCKPGQELVNGKCLKKCNNLQRRNENNRCVKNVILSVNKECKPGQELVNGKCLKKCNDLQRRNENNRCVKNVIVNVNEVNEIYETKTVVIKELANFMRGLIPVSEKGKLIGINRAIKSLEEHFGKIIIVNKLEKDLINGVKYPYIASGVITRIKTFLNKDSVTNLPVQTERIQNNIIVTTAPAVLSSQDIATPVRVPNDANFPRYNANQGVLLAHNYWKDGKPVTDPTGWLFSEKFDGVRCIWTGEELVSRNNKPIYAPSSFLELMPDIPLDGELLIGRGMFNKTISTVSKNVPVESEWAEIVYQVFDIPTNEPIPFNERMDKLLSVVNQINNPKIKLVNQIKIKDEAHMLSMTKQIEDVGGEGGMIRKPDSLYSPKRSKYLLKIKHFLDEDAIVLGYEKGKGRLSNTVGKILVKWVKNDAKFLIGSGFSDSLRDNMEKELPIGTTIIVKFFEINPDTLKPRFPVYVGKRFEQEAISLSQ